MICYFEYSKFAKRKTNLEGTNIPSGDKISSYIQVFLNSQWTTRNSFRNASWHAHWATFQTIAILFLKLRVFSFLSNVIKLGHPYIIYNRDNFLNFLYIQKLLKLLCFPPTSLQISRPFDSLPFIWFILFSLLRIFADNKSNTQIYQPGFTLNTKYLQVIMDAEQSHFSVFAGYYSRLKSEKNVFRLIQ